MGLIPHTICVALCHSNGWSMPSSRLLRGECIVVLLFLLRNTNPLIHAFSIGKGGMEGVRFVTHRYCPFAHKVWLALECASIPYRMEEIDLYGPNGKPDWFWKLNPRGTVPVVEVLSTKLKNTIVYTDSDDILDAIMGETNIFAVAPTFQKDAVQRRTIQEWRTLVNQRLLPAGKRAVLQGNHQDMHAVLDSMEAKLKEEYKAVNDDYDFCYLGGPAVKEPTMADCHALPFVWRLEQEFRILSAERYPHLLRWMQTCQKYPVIQNTLSSSWWWWW